MRGEKIPSSLIAECVDQYPHTAPEIADVLGVSAQSVVNGYSGRCNKIVCNMRPWIRDMIYMQHIMINCDEGQ